MAPVPETGQEAEWVRDRAVLATRAEVKATGRQRVLGGPEGSSKARPASGPTLH